MRPSKTGRRLTSGVALLTFAALALPLASQATSPKPPSASTGGASQRTYSSASLNGTVNPHGSETTYYFQYGATAAYGAQTTSAPAGSGTTSVPVSQAVAGLQAGASYHYRLVAVSAAGTAAGRDRVFSAKSVALKIELPRAERIVTYGRSIAIAGQLTGTGAAGHPLVLQVSQFPFLAAFANLGAPASADGAGAFSFLLSGLSQNTHVRVSTLDPVPVHSAVVTVKVAPVIVLHVRSTRRRGYVRFYGRVTPAGAGGSVALQLLRPGRGPRTLAGVGLRKAKVGSSSRFSAVLFVPHGLGGRYRAYLRQSARFAAGTSRGVIVRAAPASPKHRRR
jgi:hypothetical protein